MELIIKAKGLIRMTLTYEEKEAQIKEKWLKKLNSLRKKIKEEGINACGEVIQKPVNVPVPGGGYFGPGSGKH